MTSGEITTIVVGVITGTLPAVAAFILTLRHGAQIDDTTKRVDSHDLQLSRLTPAAHEKHCASTEQIHRALRVQGAIHKHHEPPKP